MVKPGTYRVEVVGQDGDVEWITPKADSIESARKLAESRGFRVLKVIEPPTPGYADHAYERLHPATFNQSAADDARIGVVLACLGWVFWPCLIGALYYANRANAVQRGAGDAAKNIVYVGILLAVTIGIMLARGYF